MIKVLIILLIVGCAALSVLAIFNTIRFKKIKVKTKRKVYTTPKLSDLHGKNFSDYIDYLTRDL